jgi:hypothetical protein
VSDGGFDDLWTFVPYLSAICLMLALPTLASRSRIPHVQLHLDVHQACGLTRQSRITKDEKGSNLTFRR